MLAEHKCLNDSHDVFLVLWIVCFQLLQDASFDQPLLVQALFISEDLEGANLLLLVIKALENLAKRSLSNAFLDLVAVSNMVVHVTYIFPFVVVEASVLWAIRCRERLATILSLEDVEVEDLIVLQYLCLLVVEKILA